MSTVLKLQSALARLPRGGREREAVEAGEIDAIVDRSSRNVILLPAAQRAALERNTRFRSLLALCSDWYWEQDSRYRFVAAQGAGRDAPGLDLAPLIGKTLWELPFELPGATDWQAHRTVLEWRAPFERLELGYRDRAGEPRWLSLSGEPLFDEQDRFTGYHGVARDVTEEKHGRSAWEKSNRFDQATLDALAAEICVLDAAGNVIMANRAWRASAPTAAGIAAHVAEGASYLALCEGAAGDERADGSALAAGIRRVTAQQASFFRHECELGSPAGRCRHVVTITGFQEDGAARAVVSRERLGARGPAERPLESPPASPALQLPVAHAAPAGNHLLALLPARHYRRLLPFLEPVTLSRGEMLFRQDEGSEHVFFPIDCLVSMLATTERREAIGVGLVGREGMVGIPAALGADVSEVRALVQEPGRALRMKAAHFQKAVRHCPPLERELQRHACALLAQARRSVACNRFHAVEARLASWLLMTSDHVQSREFFLTQAFLAHLFAARRATLNAAASLLRERKLIRFSRGRLVILDRQGLEAAACSCYGSNLAHRRSA